MISENQAIALVVGLSLLCMVVTDVIILHDFATALENEAAAFRASLEGIYQDRTAKDKEKNEQNA